MRPAKRFILAVVLIVAEVSVASSAHAEHPSYTILRTPTANSSHHPTHGYSPGYAYGATTHGYSYGWFGAQPRQHWSRHFGINRDYTQWTSR